jgi:hypothetical protein
MWKQEVGFTSRIVAYGALFRSNIAVAPENMAELSSVVDP